MCNGHCNLPRLWVRHILSLLKRSTAVSIKDTALPHQIIHSLLATYTSGSKHLPFLIIIISFLNFFIIPLLNFYLIIICPFNIKIFLPNDFLSRLGILTNFVNLEFLIPQLKPRLLERRGKGENPR